MFSKNKQPPIRSLVAQGCYVHGDISFTDGLGIDGTVEGMVQGMPPLDAALAKKSKGTMVFVSEQGKVLGGIRADTVIVNGLVEGPVWAERVLELQPKARISGDVSYRQLEMHQGALISGRMLPILPEPPTPLPAASVPASVPAPAPALASPPQAPSAPQAPAAPQATPQPPVVKPAEAKPAEAKPAEVKAAEARAQDPRLDNPLQSLEALLNEKRREPSLNVKTPGAEKPGGDGAA